MVLGTTTSFISPWSDKNILHSFMLIELVTWLPATREHSQLFQESEGRIFLD